MADALSGPDHAVLEQLAVRGDTPTIPREVRIWIYGSKADLDLVSERLTASWVNAVPEPEDDGKWCIFAWRVQEATEGAILAMTNEINAALADTAANYDGWETSIEQAN
jgi:hypothetical protein